MKSLLNIVHFSRISRCFDCSTVRREVIFLYHLLSPNVYLDSRYRDQVGLSVTYQSDDRVVISNKCISVPLRAGAEHTEFNFGAYSFSALLTFRVILRSIEARLKGPSFESRSNGNFMIFSPSDLSDLRPRSPDCFSTLIFRFIRVQPDKPHRP